MHSVSVTAPLILSINSFLRLVVLQRQVILEKCFVSAYTTEPTETKTSSRLFFIYKRPAISAKLARLCVVIPVGEKQIQEEKSWVPFLDTNARPPSSRRLDLWIVSHTSVSTSIIPRARWSCLYFAVCGRQVSDTNQQFLKSFSVCKQRFQKVLGPSNQ